MNLENTSFDDNQLNIEEWPKMKIELQKIFETQNRDYWEEKFKGQDCCVTPVQELDELKGKEGT